MYWVNMILFYGYTCFWFYFMDSPLEVFIKTCIGSYKNLPFAAFIIMLRIAFICFLLNILMRIRKTYTTCKIFFIEKKDETENTDTEDDTENTDTEDDTEDTDTSLTKIEENIYKMDFVIDNQPYSIIIRKSEVYDNIEGIYTDDYEDCITSEIRHFFAFNQDSAYPRYLNTIYDRKDKCLTITYKNNNERTIITDDEIYTIIENDGSGVSCQEQILSRNVIADGQVYKAESEDS